MRRMVLLAILGISFVNGSLAGTDINGLNSDGPARQYAEKLMLFGQFVGDWEFDMEIRRSDGTVAKGKGEWHFGWILQGRAVQDVWIARDDVAKADAAISECGTTVRFYDPKTDAWHAVWAGPMRGSLMTFMAKKIGEEIVMEVDSAQGLPRSNSQQPTPTRRGQWIFDRIKPNSFHWRAASSTDGGRTWRIEQEIWAQRMKK